ncbi:MAG: glycosyl hydrolase family 62 [Deltaproteobacteria bacterium]|nr:glycosyl hydrolase family 62 [Deltaproteobacteria bacterium]
MSTKRNILCFLCLEIVVSGCWDETLFATETATPNIIDTQNDSATETLDTDSAVDSDSAEPDTDTVIPQVCDLPTRFNWTSSELLIFPQGSANAIKDPSVVRFNNKWHVFATILGDGIGISYLNFSDWGSANDAVQIANVQNENLLGYRAAPQLFLFSPQNRWYVIFQTQEPAYSTTSTLEDFSSWSQTTQFMPTPPILAENDAVGFDYWIICDDLNCYMFFSGLDGKLYRARTAKSDFPNGFEGSTEIALEDDQYALYDSCNVYNVAGTGKYLLLVSALGETGRYFRSWTATRLDGEWTPLADTEDNAFASMYNVTGAEWAAWGIVQGEMLRQNPDETMTIDACDMQYLFSAEYAGEDTDVDYYGLALLTSSDTN